MDASKLSDQLTGINMGNVMAAAARDYIKEVKSSENSKSQAMDEDFDLDSLLDDPELEKLHAERLIALKEESEKRQNLLLQGHGEYRKVEEKDFLNEVTSSEYVICHFSHKEFERCKIMSKHLNILSKKFINTKFIEVDAERAPFFVNKLSIQVLPCVIFFQNGVAISRIVGFDDLGKKDDFSTKFLEEKIRKMGFFKNEKKVDTEDEYNIYKNKNLRNSFAHDSSDDSD